MIEIDDFLSHFDDAKKFSECCDYTDIKNPSDGVVYPMICKDIPEEIQNDIIFNLTFKVLSRSPKDPIIFFRRSPKGLDVPHRFHTDNSMGSYSMMLYLESKDGAGTGFAKHNETGAYTSHASDLIINKTIRDMNNSDKWTIYKTANMVKNKAVIFDSSLYHVALPIGGFGKGKKSRTVLTCFFN